jgi:hypothetical protein
MNRRNYEDMSLFSIILNQEIRRLSRQVVPIVETLLCIYILISVTSLVYIHCTFVLVLPFHEYLTAVMLTALTSKS